MEKFAVGLVLGALCGAVLVTNNYKMRTLVKKGQEEITEKLDKIMDEKINEIDKKTEEIKEEVKEKKDELVDKMKDEKTKKK